MSVAQVRFKRAFGERGEEVHRDELAKPSLSPSSERLAKKEERWFTLRRQEEKAKGECDSEWRDPV